MKKCPFCAEEIQSDAIFCKHCRKDLNTKPKSQSTLLFKWQKITLIVLALLTVISISVKDLTLTSSEKDNLFIMGYVLDILVGVVVNTLVLFIIFYIGNYIYKKFGHIGNEDQKLKNLEVKKELTQEEINDRANKAIIVIFAVALIIIIIGGIVGLLYE